jgi:streptogramin lyase
MLLKAGAAGILALALVLAAGALKAQAPGPIALAGQVSTTLEGPMEGVLVSAKRAGVPITVTVVSDARGKYRFPSARLSPGHYTLSVRAEGYDLVPVPTVELRPRVTATANLTLKPTTDLASQLSDAEWVTSMPGTDAQKVQLIGCNGCHNVSRIVNSHFTANQWIPIVQRMYTHYTYNTSPLKPQVRPNPFPPPGPDEVRPFAEYLASINLSTGPRAWTPRPFPRPTGAATHVIYTEYDVGNPVTQPHDVVVDAHGIIWYSDFVEQTLGSVDPKTGKETDYPVPLLKPDFPVGALDLELDASHNIIYLATNYQGAVEQFDTRSHRFTMLDVPKTWNNVSLQISFATAPGSDGKQWVKENGSQILRYDPATKIWDHFGPIAGTDPPHRMDIYGMNNDSQNNLYLMDIWELHGDEIGKIDAQTGAVTTFKTVSPKVSPRRGRFDPQDRLWFGEFTGNAVGMLDARSGKMYEWKMPIPFTAPYDVVPDRTGEVWVDGMWSDHVSRLDPQTGKVVDYLTPRKTNMRRAFVDNSTNPVTFWAGSDHGASILEVQPTN